MSNLLINEPPLQVSPTLAKEIGLNEAIVLQQIHYWLGNKKTGKMYDGRKWVRNTVDQWQEDNFPFWSTATIRRLLNKLEDGGYIISENLNRSAYDRTLWYSINYDSIPSTCITPFSQNDQMEVINMSRPIPETTTETTKKENIYRHEYIPEQVQQIITALSAVVKETYADGFTDQQYRDAADALIGYDATPEQVGAFAVWWKENGYYKTKPALKTLIKNWNLFSEVKPVKANGQQPQYELVEIDGELLAKQVVNNGHNR